MPASMADCRAWHLACLLWLVLLPSLATAHKASDSYLVLTAGPGEAQTLRWDLALRDLDLALDLDRDGDRVLRWGELRPQLDAIAAHAADSLALLAAGGQPCALTLTPRGLEARSDGNYLVLAGDAACPGGLQGIDYRFLASRDPTHRGLLRQDDGGATSVRPLDPNAGPQALAAAGESHFTAFVGEGVHHILIGTDHLLFLLCLLLPAIIHRQPGGWRLAPRPRAALGRVLVTVSLFTLAHSITLALAALGLVRLPPALVEAAIAASIVVAAAGNLRSSSRLHAPWLAFGFGLIHGFGFANVLDGLALPPGQFATALLAFNLGVEAGQLAVVALAVAVVFGLPWRARLVPHLMPAGSLAAMAIGGWWLVERLGGVVLAG
ncbi:MAG: HupE/UreJ family protein [Rhodocyclaceae bacterium]|nr:HupE/UreJ family protein [Rhodocyclaceae bacterium]